MRLYELMQFSTNDGPSNASERFRQKGEEAKSKTEIRTVLAQLTQALLAGMVRKSEFYSLRAILEQRLSALRSAGKVGNVALDTIVPGQASPFGPMQRY